MTTVMVALSTRPVGAEEAEQLPRIFDDVDTIEIIGDMGDFGEHMMCSCSDSDDQPY
ncbi:hypothetical protein KGQ19_16865 [Catenulispora sp. NL8]|uniref:Uncharacterized protein n=1 Tax=Catenulispora pinistramenti TaxID=2705254 RepID=A0ABS5KR84_9ACTN|nr:hypothetical protein [Catenulispora pinistramenti]MBS2548541.1 hypothetical protein [Catenulispora pinistramenti]